MNTMSMFSRSISWILLTFVASDSLSAQYRWMEFVRLLQGRAQHSSEVIGASKVLVAGGFVVQDADSMSYTITASCEIIDIVGRSVAQASPMNVPRAEFPLLMDSDSNLIAIGGVTSDAFAGGGGNRNTAYVEKYDRRSGRWLRIGELNVARRQHAAVFLNPKEILVVGGRLDDLGPTPASEIFDVETGTSRFTFEYPQSVNCPKLARLRNGRVVGFSGRESGPGSRRFSSTFMFDPTTDTWKKWRDMYAPVAWCSVIRLWDGSVLCSGGSTWESGEITKPVSFIARDSGAGFITMGKLMRPRSQHATAQIDERTCVTVGGWDEVWNGMRTSEIIDLVTGTCKQYGTVAPHVNCTMASLPRPEGSIETYLPRVTLAISGQSGLVFDGSANARSISVTDIVEVLVGPTPEFCSNHAVNVLSIIKGGFAGGSGRKVSAVGSGSVSTDGSLQLVPAVPFSRGGVWTTELIPVGCGFSSEFIFRSQSGANRAFDDGSLPGADGLAFVLQPTSREKIGETGGGIGYDGLSNALAIEFDTFKNDENLDSNGNHIAVQSSSLGGVLSAKHAPNSLLGIARNVPLLRDGVDYHVRIDYDAFLKTLTVFVDESGAFQTPRLVVNNVDLEKALKLKDGKYAFAGFTSSTGEAVASYSILSWKICACDNAIVGVAESPVDSKNNEVVLVDAVPMPVSSTCNIRLGALSGLEHARIEVYDMLGERMNQNVTSRADMGSGLLTVDTSILPDGVYLFKVLLPEGVMVARVAVAH